MVLGSSLIDCCMSNFRREGYCDAGHSPTRIANCGLAVFGGSGCPAKVFTCTNVRETVIRPPGAGLLRAGNRKTEALHLPPDPVMTHHGGWGKDMRGPCGRGDRVPDGA